METLQVSDAVEQVCVLVEHQPVAAVEDGQQPPAGPPRPAQAAPLELEAFGSVSPPTLAGLLRDLNQVLPVLKASQFHHHEEVKGGVGLRRRLDLLIWDCFCSVPEKAEASKQQSKVQRLKEKNKNLRRHGLAVIVKDGGAGEGDRRVDDGGDVPR